MTTFSDRLTAALDLTVGTGAAHHIEAEHIEFFELHLHPWGYEAQAHFVVVCVTDPSEDEVFADFIGPELASVEFSFAKTFDEFDEEATTVTLKGLVTARSVSEQAFDDIAGAPVLLRRYQISFADRAQVLWSEHCPTSLYVDSTLTQLFSDNLPGQLSLTHAWRAATVIHPVLSLGLGVDTSEASFYDFVFWLLHKECAGLFYDVAGDAYTILDNKDAGAAVLLEREEMASLEVTFAPVRRALPVVLNASTLSSAPKKEGTNEVGVIGVRNDFLVRTPIASEHEARSSLEASRARQRLAGIVTSLKSFPSTPFLPNQGLELDSALSTNLFVSGKSYRTTTVDIIATSLHEEGGVDRGKSARYDISYEIHAEQSEDPVFHLAPFTPPRWPFEVEGLVVSEIGTAPEGTYQIYPDAKTSLDFYRVSIPLYQNKQVIVRFEPKTLSGHFYFPAYKDERVLIALYFDQAEFDGFLDWRPGARLPLESQGNHLLMGKQGSSQTSMQHVYQDAKPLLSIVRTSENDTQTIRIEEGTIWMETKEEGLPRSTSRRASTRSPARGVACSSHSRTCSKGSAQRPRGSLPRYAQPAPRW